MKFSGEKVVEIYEKIQQKRPIIHCITNAVTLYQRQWRVNVCL